MAHPLRALYDTPHGVANVIILPLIMEYNAPATGEKYRESSIIIEIRAGSFGNYTKIVIE